MAVTRVTLAHVARRAGVSRATASYVMTGRRWDMRISAETEQRVTTAAREMSYRPNLVARSLRTNHVHTIGMISDVVASEPFAGDLVRASMTSALLRDRLLFIGETGGDPALETHLAQSMLDRGVEGFIYATADTKAARPAPPLRNAPLVLLNCTARIKGVPCVVPDNEHAGRVAARSLLEAGHTSDIYLVGQTVPGLVAARDRLAGIEAELATAGATLGGRVDCLWWPEPAHKAMAKFLQGGGRPTALIALNDRIALGTYQALADAKLSVPADVSVISFDNSDLAPWLQPPLDSIALPHFELAHQAVELLLQENRRGGIRRVPMELHHRASIGPPTRGPAKTTRHGPPRPTR